MLAQTKVVASISRVGTFKPREVKPDFDVQLEHLEAPSPTGPKAFYFEQKKKARQEFPIRKSSNKSNASEIDEKVEIIQGFDLRGPYLEIIDSSYYITGGNPLDNALAVSDDGFMIASVNSKIYAHDLNADTAMFRPTLTSNTISFTSFAQSAGITTSFPFDPKLIYDLNHNRFIICFLSGRTPNDSKNIIGFSSSSNPLDEWYIYEVSGNPRPQPNDTLWTDYPAISLSNEELFLTVNMIIPNVSWQVGFDGSLIWQIPLDSAYAGSENISAVFWDDIKHNGKYIRNLCPVRGADGPMGPNAYFLSNRNFDLENDSLFIVEVSNSLSSGDAELRIGVEKLDIPYGFPPNGLQEDTDQSDPTEGLQTNDARWLGAILLNDDIQFVGNSINHDNGRASVYHGFINGISSESRNVQGNLISFDTIDYGYPNIVWTGQDSCDFQTIVAFDHTAENVYAGVSSYYVMGDKKFSDITVIREGLGYIDKISGGYERWGDYFGIQRIYNEPGNLWTCGFYGNFNNNSAIHVAKLGSPNKGNLDLSIEETNPEENECEGELTFTATNTIGAFSYIFNGETLNTNSTPFDFCDGAYTISVVDDRNCSVSISDTIDWEVDTIIITSNKIFPNPYTGTELNLHINIPNDGELAVQIVAVNGQYSRTVLNQAAKKGKNHVQLNTTPLSAGVYFVHVLLDNKTLYTEKLVKIE